MLSTAAAHLYESTPQERLRLIAKREHDLRVRSFDPPTSLTAAKEPLEEWAHVLELSLLFASLHEAIARLGLRTVSEVICNFERVDAFVMTISKLDPKRVIGENRAAVEPYTKVSPPADTKATGDTSLVVRSVQSLILHCPLEAIERDGRDRALQEFAHRCRLAIEGLRAFVARHLHPQRDTIAPVGQAYAEGRLSIDEVASALKLPVPDTVALLEEHGFYRSVEGQRLEEQALRERLRLIRQDRLARGGAPDLVPALVNRDVIASQRIEDVDARPWLRS